MSSKTEKRILLILQFILSFLLAAGCGKTNKNSKEVYRILPSRKIVKIDSTAGGLAKFQIRSGDNIVFSYNRILSEIRKDTVINRSESIVFQVPSGANRVDYKGAMIDSSNAFYMMSAPNLVQYSISGGEIKGHKLNDGKWQIDLSVTVKAGGTAKSYHIRHVFSVMTR